MGQSYGTDLRGRAGGIVGEVEGKVGVLFSDLARVCGREWAEGFLLLNWVMNRNVNIEPSWDSQRDSCWNN